MRVFLALFEFLILLPGESSSFRAIGRQMKIIGQLKLPDQYFIGELKWVLNLIQRDVNGQLLSHGALFQSVKVAKWGHSPFLHLLLLRNWSLLFLVD